MSDHSAPAPAATGPDAGWRLEHSYAALPPSLHRRVDPTPVPQPRLVLLNHSFARTLGLDPVALESAEAAALFAGNALPPGAFPIAQAYAGHQYGNFTPLGDGRALLLGEQRTPDHRLVDIQLKGAGPTPFSRRGDGRAALGPMLREFLISEAMHALDIPTTRSLAVAATGAPVYREETLPGAVLTRVAASHIRVGTFEWPAAHGDLEALRALADYTLRRHDPHLADRPTRYADLLDAVLQRQIDLVARWQAVGFVHGVMNTDNMAVSGETIDYGPCAFMDTYDPATVFSSIDHHGRYAYHQQPRIAQWNLARFAETLLPLLDPDENRAIDQANTVLQSFPDRFRQAWLRRFRTKIGLSLESPDDLDLIETLLAWMHREKRDFTQTFRQLTDALSHPATLSTQPEFLAWHHRWHLRLQLEPAGPDAAILRMRHSNPAVIPRNHRVEAALETAVREGDLGPFQRLLDALARPYDPPAVDSDLAQPPPAGLDRYRTYCGT